MTAFAVPANPAFDTYDKLVAALNDWMDREDLDGAAHQLITLAEDEMQARLEPLFEQKTETLATTDGVAALPADYGTAQLVSYDGCGLVQIAPYTALSIPTEGARPVGYTLEANALKVWPAGDYTLTMLYQPEFSRLCPEAPSNRLLDKFPSLYFYGAMVFANGYVADDGRAANFRNLFDNMMVVVERYFRRQRFAGPLVPKLNVVP